MTGQPPLIVIGAPRSGTTLLSRVLQAIGVFMGWRQSATAEAFFFQTLNKWLFGQCAANTEHPGGMIYLLGDAEARGWVTEVLGDALRSPRAISFLGWPHYLRYRTPSALPVPWGWKDPRNTFALPLWEELFPGARVLHIYRHGVDVAHSLKGLHDRALAQMRRHHARWGRLYLRYLSRQVTTRARLLDSRVGTLEGALSVWEEYMCRAREQVAALGDRAMEIRYETLVRQPETILPDLAAFCGVGPPGTMLSHDSLIDERRAFAYRSNPVLQEFATRVGPRLAIFGYGNVAEEAG